MKLTEAVQILTENYSDAKRIFPDVYKMSRFFNKENNTLHITIANKDIEEFKEFSQDGLINPSDRDISQWIGMANRVETEQEADDFFMKFRKVIGDAEDKIPDFGDIYEDNKIKVVKLDNYAAVKKLCSGMQICIRSSEEYFDDYNEEGALFLIKTRGSNYVYEYNRSTGEGGLWDRGNQEVDIEEFIEEKGPFNIREMRNRSYGAFDLEIDEDGFDSFVTDIEIYS